LVQNQRNQSIARQMLTAISNAAVNSTNAYLALRALEGYAQDSTTAQRAVEERRYYSNLRTEINQAMSNPERIRQFVETQGPSILQRTQSAYESRKQQILAML
jgi:L-fucose mutarotase/ribose pyranase (RbsD/FucU family)